MDTNKPLRIGATYPQTEIAHDPAALAVIARGVEDAGYDTLLAYDHLLGAQLADRQPPLRGPYNERDPFHDPFVMFGYVAAITTRLELATGVLILPQRQTVLVARQAADVDLLSGGRLRLGVGTGWNYVEYSAMGADFGLRGKRLDEQVVLLRQLWTEQLSSFHGTTTKESFERAALVPRPVRPVPIYVGGFSEPAFRRAASVGSGFTFAGNLDVCVEGMARVRALLAESGRPAAEVDGFNYELNMLREPTVEGAVETAGAWREAGGTQVSVVSMRNGYTTGAEHVAHFAEARAALAAAGLCRP